MYWSLLGGLYSCVRAADGVDYTRLMEAEMEIVAMLIFVMGLGVVSIGVVLLSQLRFPWEK